MTEKENRCSQVEPKGQRSNQYSSTIVTAATEEFSRKEVDRWSGKCKLNTNVNGNRSAKNAKESKDKWKEILVILFMIKVGSEVHI
ncbi:MAG: hypothetical protein MPL62_14940 [Alphaproteobacteria bacterium]|nr:hypothetical protein [Alphaproteobacteria bacterium]